MADETQNRKFVAESRLIRHDSLRRAIKRASRLPRITRYIYVRDLKRRFELGWDIDFNLSDEQIEFAIAPCKCKHTRMMHEGPCFVCQQCKTFSEK